MTGFRKSGLFRRHYCVPLRLLPCSSDSGDCTTSSSREIRSIKTHPSNTHGNSLKRTALSNLVTAFAFPTTNSHSLVEVCIPEYLSDVTDRSEESYIRELQSVKGEHRRSVWPETPLFEGKSRTQPGRDGAPIRY